jgi:hypothetical protein
MFASRVKETSTTTGTGSLTLAGAVTNFVSLNSIFSNDTTAAGIPFQYFIIQQDGSEWESGIGHLTASDTMARDVVETNNSGTASLVGFSAGTKFVVATPIGRGIVPCMPTIDTSATTRCAQSLWLPWEINNTTALDGNRVYYNLYLHAVTDSVDAILYQIIASPGGRTYRAALYTVAPTTGRPGRRIVLGTSATPGANGVQASTFTAMFLPPGFYYLALGMDSTGSPTHLTYEGNGSGIGGSMLMGLDALASPVKGYYESGVSTPPVTPGTLTQSVVAQPALVFRVS